MLLVKERSRASRYWFFTHHGLLSLQAFYVTSLSLIIKDRKFSSVISLSHGCPLDSKKSCVLSLSVQVCWEHLFSAPDWPWDLLVAESLFCALGCKCVAGYPVLRFLEQLDTVVSQPGSASTPGLFWVRVPLQIFSLVPLVPTHCQTCHSKVTPPHKIISALPHVPCPLSYSFCVASGLSLSVSLPSLGWGGGRKEDRSFLSGLM